MNSLSEESTGEKIRKNLTFFLYEKIENNLLKRNTLNYASENISAQVYSIVGQNCLYSVMDKACEYKFTQK